MRYLITEKDLEHKTFGHLTFISFEPNGKKGEKVGKWLCDCGKYHITPIWNVLPTKKGQNTKSCGCQRYPKGNKNKCWSGVGELSGQFWYNLKYHAKARKLNVGITIQDAWNLFVKQNRKCALTGEILTFDSKNGSHDGSASLDRINNNIGYIEGNIQWVHKDINLMKLTHNTDYFVELCKKVAAHA